MASLEETAITPAEKTFLLVRNGWAPKHILIYTIQNNFVFPAFLKNISFFPSVFMSNYFWILLRVFMYYI